MLSIGKIGGGNGDPSYYLDAVASGQEDYYTGSGEAPGTWVGRGAAARELEGRVEDDTFLHVLDPTDRNNNKSVLAYDLTFSAPKSVSILYGVSADETSRLARAAHDAAVRDALSYWSERHAGPAAAATASTCSRTMGSPSRRSATASRAPATRSSTPTRWSITWSPVDKGIAEVKGNR